MREGLVGGRSQAQNLSGSHDEIVKFEGPMITIAARLAASRLHYAWIVIAVTFVVIVVTAGVRATSGVLIVPFENEFHWSRATISFAIGINLLFTAWSGHSLRRRWIASECAAQWPRHWQQPPSALH